MRYRNESDCTGLYILGKQTQKPITVTELERERMLNIQTLQTRAPETFPGVQKSLFGSLCEAPELASRRSYQNFTEVDFVLAAREDFAAQENLAVRLCGPRPVTKPLSNYVCEALPRIYR